jgi:hypothetical protein
MPSSVAPEATSVLQASEPSFSCADKKADGMAGDSAIALLRNYMASAFVSSGPDALVTATSTDSLDQQNLLAKPHA